MEEIQEDHKFPRAPIEGRRSNVQTIPAKLLVVTKCLLHGRHKLDRLHFRECSFDVAVPGKIRQHPDSPYHMATPALAWPGKFLKVLWLLLLRV